MLIFLLLHSFFCESIVYQNLFDSELQNFHFTLNPKNYYQIQLQIEKFPLDQRYSLLLNVTYQNENKTYNIIDYDSFYQKIPFQNVNINSSSIINIYIKYHQICNYTDNDSYLFNYILSIIENPQKTILCKFPYYSIDCSQQFIEHNLTALQYLVQSQNWLYSYYKLQDSVYSLNLENDNSDIGISIVSLGQPIYTKMPSFNQNFKIVPKQYTYTLQLIRQDNQTEFYVAIGLYNFNKTSIASLTLYLSADDQNVEQFPLWATLLILSVLLIALIVIFFVCYSIRKQLKVLALEQPSMSRILLDRYMPAKKILPHMLNETCCICLIQYIQNDLIRESPCRHYFHDLCLSEWTKKNSTCPFCRLEFTEEELKRLMTIKQTEGSPYNEKRQTSPFINKITSLRIIQHQSSEQQREHFEDSQTQLKGQEENHQEIIVQPFNSAIVQNQNQ